MTLTRRGFLQALGIGAAAVAIEEPVRKLWFVPSNAPVGSRVERWVPGQLPKFDEFTAHVKAHYDAWNYYGERDDLAPGELAVSLRDPPYWAESVKGARELQAAIEFVPDKSVLLTSILGPITASDGALLAVGPAWDLKRIS